MFVLKEELNYQPSPSCLHFKRLEPSKNKGTIQSTKSIQNKLGVTSRQKVRNTFASKVASLFRELPEYTEDVETEWNLFKSAFITSAAASCGCKRVGGQMGSEKTTCLVESRS